MMKGNTPVVDADVVDVADDPAILPATGGVRR